MKPILTAALAVTLALGAELADAQGNSGKTKGNPGKGNSGKGNVVTMQPMPQPQPAPTSGACPPGLAKKGCVPPGQAKRYGLGEVIPNYSWIQKPGKWAKPGGYYVQAGGYVYQIDETTHKVLALMGAAADLLK